MQRVFFSLFLTPAPPPHERSWCQRSSVSAQPLAEDSVTHWHFEMSPPDVMYYQYFPKTDDNMWLRCCVCLRKESFILCHHLPPPSPPRPSDHHHPPEVSELQSTVRLEAEHAHKYAGGPAAGSLWVQRYQQRGLFYVVGVADGCRPWEYRPFRCLSFSGSNKIQSPPFPCPIVKTTQSVFAVAPQGVQR